MTDLRAIGRGQGRQLEEIRSSDTVGVLTRLARAECLLELAKLSSLRIDLASYAGMVTSIITQFFPSRTCSVTIEVVGVAPITSSYGRTEEPTPENCRHALTIGDQQVGELVLVSETGHVDSTDFAAEIASQVSLSLSALVEAERLQRQAAISQAIHLAQLLSDQPSAEDLEQLVAALASLPNAIGARLEIAHSTIGGTLTLTSGAPPFERPEHVLVAGGSVGVSLRWSPSARVDESDSLAEIVKMLAAALGKAEERRLLRDEAETDPLTGIGNRRRAIRALSTAIATAERGGDYVGVVYLDLDYFKSVNDALGHDIGDQMLINFANHLVRMVRSYDTVARIGGEEFLIICPGLNERTAASLAQRIVEATPSASAHVLPSAWTQTASAGFACYPVAGDTPEALLQAADRALYAAKNGGRNQVRAAARPPLEPAT